jgi:beta-galactosidase
LIFGLAVSGVVSDARAAQPAVRYSIPLTHDWRFRFGDAGAGVTAQDFNDSDWSPAQVPHTWNRVGYYLASPAERLNQRENVNRQEGAGWYRLNFTAPDLSAGQRAWLQFDAASRVATVWLNGRELGSHAGGFSRFRLDATPALRPGASNLLVVKVDNSPPQPDSATANTFPLTGDFFVHGGLYRPVSLLITNAVHLDMLDHGGPGVYASTASVRGGQARIAVRARIRNDGLRREPVRVLVQLLDRNGVVAARIESAAIADAAGTREVNQTLHVGNARLWQGTRDPYLYTLRVELRASSGQRLDAIEQPFGIREMRLDPEKGFLLNGRPYRLLGVGYHQDREGKGWAVDDADVAEDLALIRDMGANAIRLTHYQHGQAVHDLADRMGLVLWDEIPVVTAWTQGGASQPSPGLLANARQQLQELILQNHNHASVVAWGIANEVDFGATRPDIFGRNPTGALPDPRPLLATLHELARALDSSRPTTLATCCEARGESPESGIPRVADIVESSGANRYYGWYYDQPHELGAHLDALRAAWPARSLSLSEYGAGGATSMHSDDPRGGRADATGRMQPEEYMSWVHEENWRQIAPRNYLWGAFIWNSFDFATTVRREGDADDINTKGLVSYDRKLRKDPFYFYRANWSAQPTVHVMGRRYARRAYATVDVRVYSNAPVTELKLNGRSVGTRAACEQKTCVWSRVRLDGGANRIQAVGRFDSTSVEDVVEWTVDEDATRSVRIDNGTLMAAQGATHRFGSDAWFEGGTAATVDTPGGWGRAPVAVPVAGTADRDLAATYREGRFAYRIPLRAGPHEVKLTFVEPALGAGERLFDVYADGRPMLTGVDVAAVAGAARTALVRSFPVDVKGEELLLEFRPVKGAAVVSMIEVEALPGR